MGQPLAVWQKALYKASITAAQEPLSSQLALTLTVLLRQDVATVRLVVFDPSTLGDLKTLSSASLGLHLRHFATLLFETASRSSEAARSIADDGRLHFGRHGRI